MCLVISIEKTAKALAVQLVYCDSVTFRYEVDTRLTTAYRCQPCSGIASQFDKLVLYVRVIGLITRD